MSASLSPPQTGPAVDMHVAMITAGGAGMFCGSCMHDNTWARALIQAGSEATLVPTYTPIRVDEPDQSERKVYFGGLNVYLASQLPLWGRLPRGLTRWLDHPQFIRWVTRLSISNDAAKLGQLTLDMLAGESGPHAAAGAELARHITEDLRPDVVIFSNALLVGALRALRERFAGPVYCTLQGDDVFLDGLPAGYRDRVISTIRERAADFDGFLVHSRFYRDYIRDYLGLSNATFHQLPLGIDLAGHEGRPGERDHEPFTVGYFARIAPEKGLHHLAEAFRRLHQRLPSARLLVGGYLGAAQKGYFRDVVQSLAPVGDSFQYVGSPSTHQEKVQFFRSLDVLSVPTEFQEPKGLYILEALANGVPVVQPSHGAFPELIESTGGGLLTPPRDPVRLAEALETLSGDPEFRRRLGAAGQQAVRQRFDMQSLARATLEILSPRSGAPASPRTSPESIRS